MTLNRQLILNDVDAAINAQGKPAFSHETKACYYRHPEDPAIRCGIGHLIPDDNYSPDIENVSASNPRVHSLLDAKYGTVDPDAYDHVFLLSLQHCHDFAAETVEPDFLAVFNRRIANFATEHGLVVPT